MEAQQQPHYQYPQQKEAAVSQSYDPYYAYNHYNQIPQNDTSYYYADHSNSYQYHSQTDPNLVHPSVVPIPLGTDQIHVQNQQYPYYPHGVINPPPQSQHGYMPSGQPTFSGGGSRGGRSLRGTGRGRGSFRGRGRGGDRGRPGPPRGASSLAPTQPAGPPSVQGHAAPVVPPPRMAWCELCRVECTTPEILEQHKNGKKHKKNMKVHEELQNLNKVLVSMQNPQILVSGSNPEVSQPENLVGPENTATATPSAATVENNPETIPGKDTVDKPENNRGSFMWGRMRGGRGGKWMRTHDGARRPVRLPKPRVVPLVCELCNVKCDTQAVFDSHVAGKKHLSKAKRFEGHRAVFGGGVQALYPPIPNSESTFPVPQVDQGLQDPKACRDALSQLLNQHGIQDPQTLVAQLIPVLLAQAQGTGTVCGPSGEPLWTLSGVSAPGPVAEPVMGAQDQQNAHGEGTESATGAEILNDAAATVDNKNDQQAVTGNPVTQISGGFNETTGDETLDSADGLPEIEHARPVNVLLVTATGKLSDAEHNDDAKKQEGIAEDAEAENTAPTE
ncbi:hypothetical protein Nepgr_024227 [Nepenthes gracilis]|uniref:U1-type domain-containing protein n=1 Tax=Nepenthes gracilis TaxID=150966 RepID=A0AAD3T4M8_NEPGR|nr:hypothetical protein Nepgr_024227 [Nepenthes gracilis]